MQKQLDGLTIFSLVEELNKTFAGVKIDKVFSPTHDCVAIYPIGNMPYLFISCARGNERIHLRNTQLQNPQVPPAFCMILRKYLCGGKFVSFRQLGLDKIIEIEFEAWNDEEGEPHKKLLVELLTNKGNIFLLDSQNHILDCAVKNPKSQRNLTSQSSYEPIKAQDRLNFFTCSREQFIASVRRSAIKWNKEDIKQRDLSELVGLSVAGLGRSVTDEMIYLSKLDPKAMLSYEELSDDKIDLIWQAFSHMREDFSQRKLDFSVGCDAEAKTLSVFGLEYYLSTGEIKEVRSFSSPSAMVDSFFGRAEQEEILQREKSGVTKTVKKLLDKSLKKRDIQQKELEASMDSDKLKAMGDLIINNMYLFKDPLNTMQKNKNNLVEVDLVDYFDPEMKTVRVELDPSMSISANAQVHFNKYNKAVRAKVSIAENLKKTNQDIVYFESVLESLDKVSNVKNLEEIKEELISLGHMRSKGNRKGAAKKSAPSPAKYSYADESGASYEIYVGKNNLQNDFLTLKLARNKDLWLHAKDMPGSHVVIRNDGSSEIPEDVIVAAATLAAFFSKGRLSSQVPVDATERRNVKKPNLAKPGFVIYDNQRTLYVTPSYENMKLLFGDNIS